MAGIFQGNESKIFGNLRSRFGGLVLPAVGAAVLFLSQALWGVVAIPGKWSPLSYMPVLDACWLNPLPSNAAFRLQAQAFTESEFAKTGRFSIVWQESCGTDAAGMVSVHLYDSGVDARPEVHAMIEKDLAGTDQFIANPRAAGWGIPALVKQVSIMIPIDFAGTKPRLMYLARKLEDEFPDADRRKDNLRQTLLLHEIGHILGFIHEHNHHKLIHTIGPDASRHFTS